MINRKIQRTTSWMNSVKVKICPEEEEEEFGAAKWDLGGGGENGCPGFQSATAQVQSWRMPSCTCLPTVHQTLEVIQEKIPREKWTAGRFIQGSQSVR